jgi:asparagine synthetase A
MGSLHTDFDGKRSLTAVINEIIRPIRKELVETKYHKSKQLGSEIFILSKELYLRYSELDNITKEIRVQYKDFYDKIKQVNDFEDIDL